jgi:hypothetical protein
MNPVFALCAVILVAFAPGALAQESDRGTLQRFALVAGSNEGTKNRPPLRYAVSDAASFAAVLSSLGGIAGENLVHIADPSLDEFKQGIERVRSLAASSAPGSGRKEVIVYYSGHADESGIILKKETLSYPELKKLVDAIPVDVRIAILDACASGNITREKGGTRRPAFLFDASSAMEGHAYLTSSSFDETAQESDRIKGSFFTHYLVSAMRGGADANSDGKVTLNEAYEFAFDETLRRTEKTLSGPQHAAYDIRLKGSGDLVMTDLRAGNSGLRLDPALAGRVFVRDEQGNLLAELNKTGGKRMEVGLEPGIYTITLEKPPELLTTNVTLAQGAYTDLSESVLVSALKEQTVARGEEIRSTESAGSESYRRIGFNIGILPSVSLGGKGDKLLTHFAINLAAGYTVRLEGIMISSGINTVIEEAEGAMIGAGANFCANTSDGIQIAGGVNITGGSSKCAQISGGYNQADRISGIQITGGANIARDAIPGGAQISGGFNGAGSGIQGIQISGGMNTFSDSGYCAQIAGGVNKAGVLYGIQIAGGANLTTRHLPAGAQIAGGYNLAAGKFRGITIAGGMNHLTGSSVGMHIAGGMNFVRDALEGGMISGGMNLSGSDITGIQITGGVNTARGTVRGAQIAGGVNIAETVAGAQIGSVNIAKNFTGVQIGVVNIADSCNGMPIGVFSILADNPPHPRLFTDESSHIQTGFRTGSDYLYTVIAAGIRPQRDPIQWNIGYGFGSRLSIRRAWLSLEKMFIHTNLNGSWDREQILHTKDMALIGFKLFERLSIWAGPSVNVYICSEPRTAKELAFRKLSFHAVRNGWYAVWPGCITGLEF